MRFLFFFALIVQSTVFCNGQTCNPDQYLELGKSGKLKCSFSERFLLVWWYNSTEITDDPALIKYKNSVKSGIGFTSGGFDVDSNGILIINNVSLQHEHQFSAAYIPLNAEEAIIIEVNVIVIVKPLLPFPHIHNCNENSRICFLTEEPASLSCNMKDVRPPVALYWKIRTAEGDKNISHQMTTSLGDILYTTSTSANDIFLYSHSLTLLVCQADSPPGMIQNSESLILVQRNVTDFLLVQPILKYYERGGNLELQCNNSGSSFLVWMKFESQEMTSYETLNFAIFEKENFKKIYSEEYALGQTGNLIVSVVGARHDGLYGCLSGNGTSDDLILHQAVIYEHPEPAYLSVTGCSVVTYCVLETVQEGSLTCRVKGILPQVQLEWRTFYHSDAGSISFTNQQLIVKDNGQSVDVVLTSTYRITDNGPSRLTIECRVSEPDSIFGYLSTKLDLLLIDDALKATQKTTSSSGQSSAPRGMMWIIPTILIFLLVVLVILFLVFFITRRVVKPRNSKKSGQTNAGEGIPMLDSNGTLKEIKEQFLRQLKERYKDLYDAVQPLPYIKDRLYCVDKVFVEGGIQFLETTGLQGGEEKWKSLKSYESVFQDPRVNSNRLILEGEPGYGKSTISLHFAFNWCNQRTSSPLKDVEILILLRLRQVGGVSSIYTAIRQFLLPIDTKISENDIENILQSTTSVVIILDGFDEYPNQEDSAKCDIPLIISRKMFQGFQVILTTRSSVLPRNYSPQTRRVKLTGFDENSRQFYIRKAVVGDDNAKIEIIEGYLQQNAILRDLCQVPLLFVIFAHMTHDSEHFRKLVSVTSYFRYMVSSFHSHLKNKAESEFLPKLQKFEVEHRNLDKIAFEGLKENHQKLSWDKESLNESLGEVFYQQYIKIGILVEEEVIDYFDQPGAPTMGPIQYKTEVRFYHKLFCEWYAAHYLSEVIQNNPSIDLKDYLRYLDPFDLQYLYRFTCGLNPLAAERIIDFLKNIEGGNKFAVLCILEQTGKVENIASTVRQLCEESVLISGHDSLLLQRSLIQLLEIAARNDIPIRRVDLYNCLDEVKLHERTITTTSGLALDARIPFVRLKIHVTNRPFSEKEANNILKYAGLCSLLEYVTFSGCVPPLAFHNESTLSLLQSKKITVRWRLTQKSPLYILDLNSGVWKDEFGNSQPSEEDFENLKLQIEAELDAVNEIEHRNNVRETRDRLRRKAEERKRGISG